MTESNGTEKVSFLKKLTLLLFPPKCVYCRKITNRSQIPSPALCPNCLAEYQRERSAPCTEYGNPADNCRCVLPYNNITGKYFCVSPYSKLQNTVSKRLVLTAKSKRLGYLFDFMAAQISELYGLGKYIDSKKKQNSELVITYVPRNPNTICEYGFDQAREIAERVSKLCDIKCISALKHKKSVSAQKKMNLAERLENAENSYYEGKDISLVRDRSIIIIDDMITTGATISACSSILMKNGASDIAAVTFARNTMINLPTQNE